jgi:hypothetical protein
MYLMFPNVPAFANEQISDRLERKELLDVLAFLKLTVTTIFRRGREVERNPENLASRWAWPGFSV